MGHLRTTLRIGGIALTAATIGLALEGVASADAGPGGPTRGTVTAVAAGSFTLQRSDGTSEAVQTSSSTTLAKLGTPVAPSALAVGEKVVVTLDPTAATPTAVRVTILLDRASGKVSAVTASTITLSGPRGSRDVTVSQGTEFFDGSTATTGVTVGQYVTAFGLTDAGTTLDATFVDIGARVPCGTGRPHWSTSPSTDPGSAPTDPTGASAPGSSTTVAPTAPPAPAPVVTRSSSSPASTSGAATVNGAPGVTPTTAAHGSPWSNGGHGPGQSFGGHGTQGSGYQGSGRH